MADLNWLLHLLSAVATVAGFGWLALAMDVHWEQAHGTQGPPADTRKALRVLGSAALVLAGALCLLADRPSMAVLVWLMLLAGAAPLTAYALARRPRLLRPLWPAGKP